MKYEKDDFYFIGMRTNDGEYTYNGEVIPSKEAKDLLGKKKIIEIDRRIKEMVDWKTILYGHQCDIKKGFPRVIQFVDYSTRSILYAGYTIDEYFAKNRLNKLDSSIIMN